MTTVWPLPTRFEESRKSIERSSGLPTSGRITPSTPLGTILPVTALEGSVISLTWAVEEVAEATDPTRPSPLITGSSVRTPSPVPTSTVTLEYQMVGERAITRPVTVWYPEGMSAFKPDQLAQLRVLLERRLA